MFNIYIWIFIPVVWSTDADADAADDPATPSLVGSTWTTETYDDY